jgi:hypothetical protein
MDVATSRPDFYSSPVPKDPDPHVHASRRDTCFSPNDMTSPSPYQPARAPILIPVFEDDAKLAARKAGLSPPLQPQ